MKEGVSGWLKGIAHGERLINAVTAVVHPSLYGRLVSASIATAKREGWEKHRQMHALWPTVFGGLSTVTNRASPAHTDRLAPQHGFDCLSTHGVYRGGKLGFPQIKLTVAYNPGGLFFFSGSLLQHECMTWNIRYGDRVCYARWMRDTVHEILRVPRCDWAAYNFYTHIIDPSYLEEL